MKSEFLGKQGPEGAGGQAEWGRAGGRQSSPGGGAGGSSCRGEGTRGRGQGARSSQGLWVPHSPPPSAPAHKLLSAHEGNSLLSGTGSGVGRRPHGGEQPTAAPHPQGSAGRGSVFPPLHSRLGGAPRPTGPQAHRSLGWAGGRGQELRNPPGCGGDISAPVGWPGCFGGWRSRQPPHRLSGMPARAGLGDYYLLFLKCPVVVF